MWESLAIHPTSECKRHCPFCYLKESCNSDKSLGYFQSVLKAARDIPHWIFSCNQTGPDKFEELVKLIQMAYNYKHPYSITTNFENLAYEELPIFHRAQSITVSLDEYKVHEHEFSAFVESLVQARKNGLEINVAITLTERMIYKTMYGSLLDLLLPLVDKVYFIYPKTLDKEWLSTSLFQVFVRQVGEKMKQRGLFSKISIDHCLLPILSPFQSLVNDDCAYAKTLTMMPDGSIKICPYDRKSIPINKIKEFKNIMSNKTPTVSLEMNRCPWRAKLTQREGAACYAA